MYEFRSGGTAWRVLPAFAGLLLFAAPVLAAPPVGASPPGSLAPSSEGPPPARIGNIWEGLPHQPNQADVGAAEQELGLAPSSQHDRQVEKELQELGNQLLKEEESGH